MKPLGIVIPEMPIESIRNDHRLFLCPDNGGMSLPARQRFRLSRGSSHPRLGRISPAHE